MQYITFQEGFLDNVKNRVQTNLANAADAAHTVVNGVRRFGQNLTNFANRSKTKVNQFARAVGAKGYSGNPTAEGHPVMQTAMIKRQIPNSPTNTTGALYKKKPM